MKRPNLVETTSASRKNEPSFNRPESHNTRPTPGATETFLQVSNQAYAELMKHKAEEQREREASEALVCLQWRYA
ncbi:hypothetical protein FS749_016242 [Ceratobasidium sp. UAMH 11750]|nr:hypothetical protein FS749_016242 [Ceratobasidium sp. UAMH 11750]